MKVIVVAAALAAACALAASAGATAGATAPPTADARAWLVVNPSTGEILAQHDDRHRTPIASITKLMTVIVVLQHLKLTDVVHVDPRAAAVGREAGVESIYLQPGETMTVAELLEGALIESADDAVDALALATAPSFTAFADLMNAEGKKLGLTDSHFVRPDGLDAPDEYSSARDVIRLALAAMKLAPVRTTVRKETATIGGDRTLHTWNDLLGVFPGVFGVKTGHTDDAGWAQVAAVHGGGTTIYATILGSPTRARRNRDLEALLAYGLAQYRQVDAVGTGRSYATVALPYGRSALQLVAATRLHAVVRLGDSLSERVIAPAAVSLPVHRGQVIGRVQVWLRGRLLGSRPLVASRSVGKPGFTGRVGWYAGRTVHDVAALLSP